MHLIIMIFNLLTFIQTIPNCCMMEIKKIEYPNDYCLNSANWRILKIFTIETLQTPPVVLVSAPLGRWAYIVKIGIVRCGFYTIWFQIICWCFISYTNFKCEITFYIRLWKRTADNATRVSPKLINSKCYPYQSFHVYADKF